MTYQTTAEKIWLADIANDRCTIGSGDQEIASDIPLNIGRLMAAAPELLAALQWAVEELSDSLDPDYQDAIAAARATIAKATARSDA